MGPAEKIKKVKQNPSKGVGCFPYPLEIIQTYDECNFQSVLKLSTNSNILIK